MHDHLMRPNRADFGQAAQVALTAAELSRKETLHALPGNCNPGRAATETQDIHTVILNTLAR